MSLISWSPNVLSNPLFVRMHTIFAITTLCYYSGSVGQMYDVCYSERHCHVYKASFKPEVFRVYSVCLRAEGLFGDLTKLLRGGPVREEEDRTKKGNGHKEEMVFKERTRPSRRDTERSIWFWERWAERDIKRKPWIHSNLCPFKKDHLKTERDQPQRTEHWAQSLTEAEGNS